MKLIRPIHRDIVLFYILLYLLIQFMTFNYGFNHEEFREYHAYTSILEGKLPYLDYIWPYGLLGPFIYALLFKIFGAELIVLRITAIILGCIGIILAYKVSKFIMPKKIAALSGFLAMACFSGACSYTYSPYFGTLANLAIVLMIFRFINVRKIHYLFIAGLLLNISFFIHPLTFGINMLFSVLAWLVIVALAMKLNIIRFLKLVFIFLIGIFIFAVPLHLFILTRVPFNRVFTLIWFHQKFPLTIPSLKVNLPEVHSISDLIHKLGVIRLKLAIGLIDPAMFHLLLFIVPAIAVILIIYWMKNKRAYQLVLQISFLVILICSNFGYFLYRGHYFRFTAVLGTFGKFYIQYSLILLTFLVYLLFKYLLSLNNLRILKIFTKLSCLLFIILFFFFYYGAGFISIFNKKWYTFDIKSIKGIYLGKDTVEAYIKVSEYIKNSSNPNDKLFVTWYDPAYYILSNRKSIFPENPYIGYMPFDKLVDSSYLPGYNGVVPMKIEEVIINRIKNEKPKFIVYKPYVPLVEQMSRRYIGPKVEKYIFDNFLLAKRFYIRRYDYEIKVLTRKQD